MRPIVLALVTLVLTGCSTRLVKPATLAELREGKRIAGLRYYFPVRGDSRGEDNPYNYQMNEALNHWEASEAKTRGDITGFVIDTKNDFWRYEGIAGGELHAFEFIVDGATRPIKGILAEPRWPPGVMGYQARLAHLGLKLGKVIAVGEAEGKYEGRHRNFVLAETSDPVLLAGLDARGGAVELVWIVRALGKRHQSLAWMLDIGDDWQSFEERTRKRLGGGKPDWVWLEGALATLVAVAVTPEGAALSRTVQEVLGRELAEAGRARGAAGEPTAGAWLAALQRECRALASLARLRPLREEERAPAVAAFRALASVMDARAARDPAGGGATLRAAAVYARSLGEDAGAGAAPALAALPRATSRLVPLLDALADTPEPSFSRAERLMAGLDTLVEGHTEEPRVAALAAPTFALLEGWAASWAERGLAASSVWLRLGVDHAAGRFHPHVRWFRDTMAAPDTPASQRDALQLLGRVLGAPAAGSYAAPAFEHMVSRLELLEYERGARAGAHGIQELAWLVEQAGGPALTFERGPVQADVREGVTGYTVSETRTRAVEVEVDTTAAYAARDAAIAELEQHLAWIEAERAKILADMPLAVKDEDAVVDRVTGMAIGPNTGPGKYLNQKRRRLQDRLDALETSRRVSLEQYRRLTGTVPAGTRTEHRTETVERVQKVLVYQGVLTARHRLEGGGASSTFTHIYNIADLHMRSYKGKADLVRSRTEVMQRQEKTELWPLIRRWLDARLAVVLEEGRTKHGWTDEELAAERAALTTMFTPRVAK